ncbi:MFS transporter [Desulfoscipio sp. XC116]|uniref:MFS transporter n=1 Tax=Desulfoscipio sp. XC116 TaxID=3144975 RepID=UPI00325BF775
MLAKMDGAEMIPTKTNNFPHNYRAGHSTAPTEKANAKMLLLAVILLVIIMAYTGTLNYMTFVDNYNKSLVNTYSIAGDELVRKIEYALHYGKSIDNFYGMSDTLNELKKIVKEVDYINIISPRGEILYDLHGFVNNETLPEELLTTAVFQQGTINEKCSYQSFEGKHYIFLKILGSDANWVATLGMALPGNLFQNLNNDNKNKLVVYLAGVVLATFFLLYIILLKTELLTSDGQVNRKRILIIFIAVLGSAQLLYCGINYHLFKNAYGDLALQSKSFVENMVAQNIENVYRMGIGLEDVDGVDEYLGKIKSGLPLLESIAITEPGSGTGAVVMDSVNSRAVASVSARISSAYIDRLMLEILLDMLTVLIISFFFMIELTLLATMVMSSGSIPGANKKFSPAISHTSELIRGLIFVVNICVYMSITFVPIVMQNLYQPIWGMPRDVVLGLPISAEMLGGILAIVVAGLLIDKRGWRTIFYTGVLFLAVGNLFSGLSSNVIPFILSRMIAGLGIGFILMTLRSLAVSLPERNFAIAEFSAGSIAGLNCGAVIGGMLADRIGYQTVFCLSAMMVIFSCAYVYKLMAGLEIERRITSAVSAWNKFVNFISDKRALLFLLLIFAPFFIAGAFLDYYFPLFAKGHDLTQGDISRAFLLKGLCIIYLGPVLTRLATRYLGDKKGIIFSLFIIACALAVFMFWGTIPAAFVTVILLGIAESFGLAMQTTYFLNLKPVRDLEINKAIAYFSVMVNASMMAGPIIFGFTLTLGMRMGVGLITGVLLALLMAFILISNRYQQQIN